MNYFLPNTPHTHRYKWKREFIDVANLRSKVYTTSVKYHFHMWYMYKTNIYIKINKAAKQLKRDFPHTKTVCELFGIHNEYYLT